MKHSDNTAITYYACSVLISLLLSITLILILDWPVSAEIPLSISIFIQLVAIARYVHHFLQESESMVEVYAYLKEGAADSHAPGN